MVDGDRATRWIPPRYLPYSSRQFWSGWHARLHEIYPQVNDVGEVSDPDSSIIAFFEGGRKQFDGIDTGLSTVFDFPLCNALRDVIIKGDFDAENRDRVAAR